MSGACSICCRQEGRTWVLPQPERSFCVGGKCKSCHEKKAFPVKAGAEVHQYQLLAYADAPNGTVCVEPATAETDPAMFAGFAMHCFFATDTGGVTFLSGGGFAVDMAVMPEGWTWDAASIAAFSARGLCPEVVCGLETAAKEEG